MAFARPPLPEAFADCAENIAIADKPPGFISIEELLGSDLLQAGFDGLNGRWGPGDSRAVISLWTQGYFGRLLRPVLAYGLLKGVWFETSLDRMNVLLSEIGTPMRFQLDQVRGANTRNHLHHLITDNVTPLIERLVERTGTSERIHWSNASYAFHRAFRQVSSALGCRLDAVDTVNQQFEELRAFLGRDHPLFRLTVLQNDEMGDLRPVRRVCCIRFKLACLKKCGAACPILPGREVEC
jgi:ferric iron reductase protein FhuF